MREASKRVNVIATYEAIRRDLVAVGSLIIFHHNRVSLDGNADMLVASSLIYQSQLTNQVIKNFNVQLMIF